MESQVLPLSILLKVLRQAAELLLQVGYQPVKKGIGFDAERAIGLFGMELNEALDFASIMKGTGCWYDKERIKKWQPKKDHGLGQSILAIDSVSFYLQDPHFTIDMCRTPQQLKVVISRLESLRQKGF